MNHSDSEIRARILEKAREHFLQFGFSTVTMSDIATGLGMSKKTMYAHFQSKEDLASEMVKTLQTEMTSQIDALVEDQSMDFMEKLNRILDLTASHHSQLTPHFRMDLQKHAPGVCKCSDDFQHQQIHAVVSKLIQEGIRKGVFRSDIDEPIVTSMFLASFQSLLRAESLARLQRPIPQIIEAISSVMFQGVLADEVRPRLRTQPADALVASTVQ
jgi:TetR/AcrR family transcriptional regulator, cholesterol catabolism regulator